MRVGEKSKWMSYVQTGSVNYKHSREKSNEKIANPARKIEQFSLISCQKLFQTNSILKIKSFSMELQNL